MYDGEEQLRPGSFSTAWKALTDDVFGCGDADILSFSSLRPRMIIEDGTRLRVVR
jgi:hypothetical protein